MCDTTRNVFSTPNTNRRILRDCLIAHLQCKTVLEPPEVADKLRVMLTQDNWRQYILEVIGTVIDDWGWPINVITICPKSIFNRMLLSNEINEKFDFLTAMEDESGVHYDKTIYSPCVQTHSISPLHFAIEEDILTYVEFEDTPMASLLNTVDSITTLLLQKSDQYKDGKFKSAAEEIIGRLGLIRGRIVGEHFNILDGIED